MENKSIAVIERIKDRLDILNQEEISKQINNLGYGENYLEKMIEEQTKSSVAVAVLKHFGKDFRNFVYHSHTKTLSFNWRGLEPFITSKELEGFKKSTYGISLLPLNLKVVLDVEYKKK